MRIGILTFHDADNYGAVLQAYALKEVIKHLKYSCVEIIDYKQPHIIGDYKLFNKFGAKSIWTYIRTLIIILIFPHYYLQKAKFRRFRERYMNISSVSYVTSKDINGYDTYVAGSDQLWNTELTKDDETYFLSFSVEKGKKIAYAVSLGNDAISDKQVALIKKYINNFDYISVREESAVKEIIPFTEKEVTLVLDPTLLVSKESWDNLIKVNKPKYKYLLLYILSVNDEVLKITDVIAKQLHLKVLYINNSPRRNKYGFKNQRCVGPEDFVALIKNVEFVVTNSFHGTVFSIIFKKNFVAIPHQTRGARMTSLLNRLKLNERIITNHNQVLENFHFDVDYKTVDLILCEERTKSFNFLKAALEQ